MIFLIWKKKLENHIIIYQWFLKNFKITFWKIATIILGIYESIGVMLQANMGQNFFLPGL